MNHNARSFRSKFDNAVQTAKHYGQRAAAVGTGLMASGAAFAQQADVEAAIDAQQTIALAVAAAGTIAILIVKYSKLARRG
jgi:hypothetical protein